ncbi:GNAT family N-acetyltransferase [Luteimonas kalidii]|uniref:GNAT family N-acetyltransferase n=1 Tax=Luteimonas kalidii TaxID=3042025 RepID=A0ABT6JP71_9GAMM|nr:GNAT family N-acetyltransferase [Luteimonas kalidii]MDH5832475.1 GNAT family N-acetyltransferase [Luteimonas kalidii]
MDPIDIRHRDGEGFEAVFPEGRAVLDYQLADGRLVIVHTGVPAELRGRGVAGQLVRAAFEHARAAGLRVEPRCSYAAEWSGRHPEFADLLATG